MLLKEEKRESGWLATDLQWMVNCQLSEDKADWRYIPVRKLLRAFVPAEVFVEGKCFAWEVAGPGESLIKSAVREGAWISADNLKQILRHLGIPFPAQRLKVDLAQALVNHFFGDSDSVTAEERKRMVAGLTWRGKFEHLGDKEKEILAWVSELDEENRNAPEFLRIIKLAKEKLQQTSEEKVAAETRKTVEKEFQKIQETKEQEMERVRILEEERRKKAAAEAEAAAEAKTAGGSSKEKADSSRKASQTPPSLKDFLKDEMRAKKISLNRDEKGYGYRAFYPSLLFTIG